MCVSGCDNETGANFATIQYCRIRALFKKKKKKGPMLLHSFLCVIQFIQKGEGKFFPNDWMDPIKKLL